MDKDYIIFQENGLFGAKNQTGDIIIEPQYIEMQPFCCGLSQVRNDKYQYAYINAENKQVVPFGLYAWCDPQLVCGVARVMRYVPNTEQKCWGVINQWGKIIISLSFDYIQPIYTSKLHCIKAIQKGENRMINLLSLGIRSDRNSRLEDELAVKFPVIYNPARVRHSLEIGKKPKTERPHSIYTNEYTFDNETSLSEWQELMDDAFEGDASNCWNID